MLRPNAARYRRQHELSDTGRAWTYQTATPFQLWAAASAADWMRLNAQTLSERKAAQNAAPVYQYIFSWVPPVLDGKPGTYHACEIAYVFDNIDLCIH